jgi:hypothetical protein
VLGLGVTLTAVGAFGIGLIDSNSLFPLNIVTGLLRGVMFLPFLVAIQLLIQWLIWSKVRLRQDWSLTRIAITTYLPVFTILLLTAVSLSIMTSPTRTFETWLLKPIPASVEKLRRWQWTGMDSKVVALKFRIGTADLQNLIRQNQFKGYNASADDLAKAGERIHKLTGAVFDLASEWRAYDASENGREKRLFVNRNTSEGVFLLYLYNPVDYEERAKGVAH